MRTFQFGYVAGNAPQIFLSGGRGTTFTFTAEDYATAGNASVVDTNSVYEDDEDANQILTVLDGGGPTIDGLTSELEGTAVVSWTDGAGAEQTTTIGWVTANDSVDTDLLVFLSGEIPPAGTTVTITARDFSPSPASYSDFATLAEIPCFTVGTKIQTDRGEVAIETLGAGDLVQTMDNGLQPIRWIGHTSRPAVGAFAPILIREGALGTSADLKVSPHHRMLLTGWRAQSLFGSDQILATAASLVNDHTILRVEGGVVDYYHILFDHHEIVFANGAPSESFHPQAVATTAMDETTRQEVLALFPQLGIDAPADVPTARKTITRSEEYLAAELFLGT